VFNFDQLEILCFFMVLVRFGTIFALLPVTGERTVPAPVKVLLALSLTLMMFPVLLSTGQVNPADAAVWGASAGGLIGMTVAEVAFGLAVGFCSRMVFFAIEAGADMAGAFMGFSMANTVDPNQETQTQVVTQIQVTLAMLLFLVLDGHHIMFRAALESYSVVGLGQIDLAGGDFQARLIELSAGTLRTALQLAGPVAVALFAVNMVYAVLAKAMPQLNVLVLSFSVSAFVGLFVMFMSIPEFQSTAAEMFSKVGGQMYEVMKALKGA
jgi:flagellar biosynthetic protein FliR